MDDRTIESAYSFDEAERHRVIGVMDRIASAASGSAVSPCCCFDISPGEKGKRSMALVVQNGIGGSLVLSESITVVGNEWEIGNILLPHNLNGYVQVVSLLAGLAAIDDLAWQRGNG
jgi:hypothetical protein